jgi:hypothetical protein
MSRHPVARDLRSPKYRSRVVPDKRAAAVDRLSAVEMARLYEFIDGPVPQEIASMTDDELLAELSADADWRWRNDWD